MGYSFLSHCLDLEICQQMMKIYYAQACSLLNVLALALMVVAMISFLLPLTP